MSAHSRFSRCGPCHVLTHLRLRIPQAHLHVTNRSTLRTVTRVVLCSTTLSAYLVFAYSFLYTLALFFAGFVGCKVLIVHARREVRVSCVGYLSLIALDTILEPIIRTVVPCIAVGAQRDMKSPTKILPFLPEYTLCV